LPTPGQNSGAQTSIVAVIGNHLESGGFCRYGSKADMAAAVCDVRFNPH
jgi:hypothetical protein